MPAKRLAPLGRLSCGERLSIERRRRKESQCAASERFNVSVFTYGQWERDAAEGPMRQSFSLTNVERCILYRRRLGWTQDYVSFMMGRSRAWVNMMERGQIPCRELLDFWEV